MLLRVVRKLTNKTCWLLPHNVKSRTKILCHCCFTDMMSCILKGVWEGYSLHISGKDSRMSVVYVTCLNLIVEYLFFASTVYLVLSKETNL